MNDIVHGFIPGRSQLTAARIHCGADWVFSLDIRSFFPSISQNRIKATLQELGYQSQAARLMSSLCSLRDALPQGAPSSPALSNLCMKVTDNQLSAIAQRYCARITRYADDICISGTGTFDANIKAEIFDVMARNNWHIAEEKTDLSIKPQRLRVLGLLVDGDKPRLSSAYRKRVRMMRHQLASGKLEPRTRRVFSGHVAYLRMIEDAS